MKTPQALILAAAAVLAAGVARATEMPSDTGRFYFLDANPNVVVYYDAASLKHDGDAVAGWRYLVFNVPPEGAAPSMWQRFSIDCRTILISSLGAIGLDKAGAQVSNTIQDKPYGIKPIEGGSLDAELALAVCGTPEPSDAAPYKSRDDLVKSAADWFAQQ